MAKISNIIDKAISANGSHYELHYSRKQQFYCSGIASDFHTITSVQLSNYPTEGALHEAIASAKRIYESVKSKSYLVIVYKFNLSKDITDDEKNEGSQFYRKSYSRKANVPASVCIPFGDNNIGGTVVGVDYEILLKKQDPSSVKYFVFSDINNPQGTITYSKYNRGILGGLPQDRCEVEYTKERHDFFESIAINLRVIASLILNFAQLSQEQQLSIMSNPQQKLLK